MSIKVRKKTNQQFQQHPLTVKTVEAWRANRYNFGSMIGELVDNASDAGAKRIHITIEPDEKDHVGRIIISDDGGGMDDDLLFNSFTIGASRIYAPQSRGKFGQGGTMSCLGLAAKKTTITHDGASVIGRFYDMDIIREQGTWGTRPHTDKTMLVASWLRHAIEEDRGTVIILEHFDRGNKRVSSVANIFKRYISSTFAEEIKYGNLQVQVNGIPVQDACPVGSDHKSAIIKTETVSHDGKAIEIKMVDLANVPLTHFNADYEKKHMVRDCGMYFSRKGRVIAPRIMTGEQSWEGGARQRHPDVSRGRVLIRFRDELDEEFGVSASKDSISPSQALMDKINNTVNPFFRVLAAQAIQRKEDKKATREQKNKTLEEMTVKANDPFVKPTKKRGNSSRAGAKSKVRDIRNNQEVQRYIDEIKHESFGNSSAAWRYDMVSKILTINYDHDFISRFFYNGVEETQISSLAVPIAFEAAKLQLPEEADGASLENCIKEFERHFFNKLNAISRS